MEARRIKMNEISASSCLVLLPKQKQPTFVDMMSKRKSKIDYLSKINHFLFEPCLWRILSTSLNFSRRHPSRTKIRNVIHCYFVSLVPFIPVFAGRFAVINTFPLLWFIAFIQYRAVPFEKAPYLGISVSRYLPVILILCVYLLRLSFYDKPVKDPLN